MESETDNAPSDAPETETPNAPDAENIAFNYDTGFLCTYHLMNETEDDMEMSDNLYKIQMSQALRMNMDIARVLSGREDEFDMETLSKFVIFVSDKTKPCYDERYKAVLRKHPCWKLSSEELYSRSALEYNDSNDERDSQEDDVVINNIIPILMSYHTFHAFHRCMIDMFSIPNGMGLISDESLRLLEDSYDAIYEEMKRAPTS